jgi:hypothetical protein
MSDWILEHSTIRDNKIYRHEYRQHDDGRLDWRIKTIFIKPFKDGQKPWDIEMDLALEAAANR